MEVDAEMQPEPTDVSANTTTAEVGTVKKKRKYPKKKKRESEGGQPNYYRNAYVRYCDAMRPKVAEEHPELDPVALTKLVADRWYKETDENKHQYQEEAKADKIRFHAEVKVYKETHPEYAPNMKGKKKKLKGDENSDDKKTKFEDVDNKSSKERSSKSANTVMHNNNELPIFTDTFLAHNLQIETELRQLRKQSNDIEIQNDFLQKFVENMQGAVTKISAEITAEKQFNSNLNVYLTKLKCILGSSFNSLSLPSIGVASIENIKDFLEVLTDPSTPASTVNKARDIIKKTDLKI